MKKTIDVISVQRKRIGIGFIKSRKSDSKIMDMALDMIAVSKGKAIELADVIVDQSSGMDIDRPEIDVLISWMEKKQIDVVVLKNIFDVSRDCEELLKFLSKAEELNLSVYSLEHGFKLACVPWDGGSGC